MNIPLTIFVDGIWRQPGRFKHWGRALRNLGGESFEHSYDSSGRISIDRLGEKLAIQIRELNQPVNLLGFSMGGLVIRAAHHFDPALPIERVAFLNTPHAGSWLAWTLPLPAVRQMRPKSSFLKSLDSIRWSIPTISIHSPGDAMVLPGSSARFAAATHSISCPIPAHMWPVFSPSIRKRVLAFLSHPKTQTDIPQRTRNTGYQPVH